MTCIIISNKKSGTELLRKHIAAAGNLQLLTICENLLSAEQFLNDTTPDIIFMDPDLPGKNKIDLIRTWQSSSVLIVTAASDAYAMQAFELGITDYLLMPVSSERFFTALAKASRYLQPARLVKPVETLANYFFVKSDNRFEKIDTKGILYIEGLQNYITIQTETKKVITYSSLKSIESYLSEKEFLRVQKSFIVSLSKIDRIDSDDVVIGKTSIPIGRAIKRDVLRVILNNRLYRHEC